MDIALHEKEIMIVVGPNMWNVVDIPHDARSALKTGKSDCGRFRKFLASSGQIES
ncbi:MAG: hypothetical protein NVSMB62_12640 [Acidobacteriaceae bacterium]